MDVARTRRPAAPGGSVRLLARTYGRALRLLAGERRTLALLVAANVGIGLVQLAEPVLFGAVVDSITAGGTAVFELIALWAVLGIGGIAGGVVVALHADRLAHRRRTAAMAAGVRARDHAPAQLPRPHRLRAAWCAPCSPAPTPCSCCGWASSASTSRRSWASPASSRPRSFMNPPLAAVLAALALVYVGVNLLVVRRTQAGQRVVERHHQDVFGRVGDVIGNVTVVQSYARLAAEATELQEPDAPAARGAVPRARLVGAAHHPHPRLGHRRHGGDLRRRAVLARRGEITVGEIVSFIGFANLLIGRLDQLTGFVGRFFLQAPTVDAFFDLLGHQDDVRDAPNASRTRRRPRPGRVRGRDLPLPRLRAGHLRPLLHGRARPRPWPWSAPPAPARPRRWPSSSACATPTRPHPARRHGHPRGSP